MTRRKSTTRTAPANTSFPPVAAGKASSTNWLRQVLLASLIGVYVATPLIPSEAAADYGSGIPLVMLLWIIAIIWLAQGMLRGQLEVRFEPVGTVFMFLAGWLAMSAIVMAPYGAPRPAINMLWEWTAYVIGFRMCLQLIRSAVEARAVCAVMISLAVALSTYGAFQFAVSLPSQRARYFDATVAERAEIRKNAGIHAAEGSPRVDHFEQRLLSVEPMGTFSLANSLAAFLVPWLIVTLGILLHIGFRQTGERGRLAGILVVLTMIGGCLLFTKSRAGMLAAITGSILMVGMQWRELPAKFWRVAIRTFAVLAVITGTAIGIGGLDLEVFSEAPKSLRYRFEYWQATWQLIADHPWFGCGLGNFQEYYLQYKLPQASEEIKDPHNFLLETWATGGIPASIALIGMLILFLWCCRRGPRAESQAVGERTTETAARETVQQEIRCVYGGAAAGLLFALPLSVLAGFMLPLEFFAVTIVPAGLCLWILYDWVCQGELPRATTVVAVCMSLVSLTFTGGIGYPGVAGSVWLLMAISLCGQHENLALTLHPLRRTRLVVSVLLVATLFLACYLTAYQPVLSGKDHWDAEHWNELAAKQFDQWLASGKDADFSDFEHNLGMMLRRNAHSPNALRQAGLWYLLAGIKANAPAHLQESVKHMSRAVQLYPSSSAMQADYAWSLQLVGRAEEAAQAAATSLQLDHLNPHAELKLQQRRLFDEPPAGAFPGLQITPAGQSVDQCMMRLRNG